VTGGYVIWWQIWWRGNDIGTNCHCIPLFPIFYHYSTQCPFRCARAHAKHESLIFSSHSSDTMFRKGSEANSGLENDFLHGSGQESRGILDTCYKATNMRQSPDRPADDVATCLHMPVSPPGGAGWLTAKFLIPYGKREE
jgi:hypothetical protein